MKFSRSAVLALALLAGTMMGGSAFAAPTDEDIDKRVTTFKEATSGAADAAVRRAAIATALEGLAIEELSLAQIKKLNKGGILRSAMDKRAAIHDRLTALAGESTAEGAEAALMAADFLPYPPTATRESMEQLAKAKTAAMLQATEHPAFGEAVAGEAGRQFLVTIASIDGADLAGKPIWKFVEQAIPTTATVQELQGVIGVINAAADPDAKVAPAQLDAIRKKIVALVASTRATLAASDVSDPDEAKAAKKVEARERTLKGLDGRLDFLNGAFASGELIGQKSPAFTFEWSSGDKKISTLDDLKGKVVVIDFWATWCGPCIGSFDQVRELTAHYAGYDVVVLGVTSIQGFHYKRSLEENVKPERVDTKDNPAEEMKLMGEFVKDMNMTWTVVFSKQNVFNPDFGVNGIPHVAIIDPAGIVRYRGLHPASDPIKKHEMIDGLLKEFKLPTPPAVEEKKEEKRDEKKGG
jgi:thiol-disulfide isomerase/thioredoxin